jgi:(p)ppGpp synthase/HD superfamily hydrolase
LERAIAIAAEAHAGQVDKAGAPYVLHPLRMMFRVSSVDERIVAVLHDVCEDCPGWTFDRLRSEGFPDHIIEALQSVTKRDGEDYDDFVRRAAANPIGRSVKLADLLENSDLSRIAAPSERDIQRIEKYRRAIELISQLPAMAPEHKEKANKETARDKLAKALLTNPRFHEAPKTGQG